MSMSAPQAPDPRQTADTQQYYNTQSAEQQQAMNMVSQGTPLGSLQYGVIGRDPITGMPMYGANTSLSPEEQALLGQQQATQYGAANVGRGLLGDVAGFYANPPNLDPSTMTATTMGMEQKYLNPWFQQQQGDLDAKLRDQGIAPGSQAYDRAQQALAEAQGGTMANTFLQAEPQAFQQAATAYQMPLTTTGALAQYLLGFATPQMPTFQQTPTTQMQPANYAGLAEQNYQNQMGQYQAMMSGLFGIPTGLATGGGMYLGKKLLGP